ncbi:MAG: hypothetical protein JSS36_10055 [Proteobacteria bacterium]|nr:hypothetical protein [Pseudomonadota bacterium]
MEYRLYPCGNGSEPAVCADQGRTRRLLLVPALFDEANRMRRFTVEVMRRLDVAGIDCFLPDLPGCGESVAPIEAQTPAGWRMAMTAAARHFAASHVLAIRGGALVMPELPGWAYAPAKGAGLLRQMLRGRVVAAKEAGREESTEGLLQLGLTGGIELAGYRLSSDFIAQFHNLELHSSEMISTIDQAMIGGPGLWLRAEPGEDAAQADALAAAVAVGLAA